MTGRQRAGRTGPRNEESPLAVQQMFAGTAVADYDAALAWYERFMGRPPDFFPQEKEAVWQAPRRSAGWGRSA